MSARYLSVLTAVALSATLAACGGASKNDQATKKICSARTDIQKSIENLGSLTLSTGTINQVKTDLTTIRTSLKTIQDQEKNLDSGTRKDQVQQVNATFTKELQTVASNIGTNLSISNAEAQLKAAGTNLLNSYKQVLEPIDCPS